MLPELLPAASRAEWRPVAVLLRVQAVPQKLAAAVLLRVAAEQAVPTVAARRAVAMRVQPVRGPAAAAQTAGPVLRGQLLVAGPTPAAAALLRVQLRVQLPTVRQQELHQ